ncbi:hypothetical protein OHS17_00790 [Streptomyces sp. NBC_00523]|uniref:hypothetical protein n=1 Tax=Streptomyces sp. NBC_00523 TaxID=2975765 RepID=UPI002E81E9F3|nr:hypothetical protein [Streptomyces sp. NBC_00523]WUC98286.1 hypothetical protein OHS17_00790 [Streptomyces sp. NBC_00523]
MTTQAERQLAAGHWLLSAAPNLRKSRDDWKVKGSTWLRPGVLFGAIVIPADLVHRALDVDSPNQCRRLLATHLEGGPVFYSPEHFRREGSYTVLVTASTAMAWRSRGSVAHSYRALLQVPSPRASEPQAGDCPWWVVPLDGPGLHCRARPLAALITAGRLADDRTRGSRHA